MTTVNTPIGVPNEINFSLPSSMLPSRKFEYRVAPNGQSLFTQSNQTIRFTLSQMQRTLYNMQTAYVLGSINFNPGAGVAGTDVHHLLGSWYSLFSRQVIRTSQGRVLETIENPGLLANMITNVTMNNAERRALNNAFGFDDSTANTNAGVRIYGKDTKDADLDIGGELNNELNFTFAIPLIGILNISKFYPAWFGDLEIELTLAPLSNFTVRTAGTVDLTGYTVSDVEFCVEALELSPESYQMILANNPGQVVLKTQSYSYGNGSLEGGKTGAADINFQIKCNSLKQILWYAQPTDACEKTYAGVCPNLENWNFICNGISYPQRPVAAKFPAEAYLQNMKSFGSVYSSNHSGCLTRNEFNVASSSDTKFYRKYNTDVTKILTKANKWYQILDLETINSNKESLYTGISTSSTSSMLRLNLNRALAAVTHNIHYFACFDVMITMDMATNIVDVVS